MDYFAVWCNNGEEAETPGFLQVEVFAARNRIALSLDLPRRLISVGPLCLPELFFSNGKASQFFEFGEEIQSV